jgi:hypothetical protein
MHMLLLSLCWAAILAASVLPLWTITSGAVCDLRTLSVDFEMLEQTVLANVQPPDWAAIQWLSVHSSVAYWSDNFPFPGVRKFDANLASLLLGLRRVTMLEDMTGVMSFGAVAAGNASAIYVVESNGGVILEVKKTSTVLAPDYRVLKSGFNNLSGIAVDSASTTLYWFANNALFVGNTRDNSFSVLQDLESLAPPSRAPKSLALNEFGRFLVWTDIGQNGIYRLSLLSAMVTFLPATLAVFGVATETSTSRLYVSLVENGTNTRVALISDTFDSMNTSVYFARGASPCCGFVLPIAIDALYLPAICSAGTFGDHCQPCPQGTNASVPLQDGCFGVCPTNTYCAFATAFPIPTIFAQNFTQSNSIVFTDVVFGDSKIPAYFLITCMGVMGFVTLFFTLLLIISRLSHYVTIYGKVKYVCQTIDICYRSKHYNETPALMLHRKSIIGGFQSLLFPGLFIVIAIYIGISWNASPIVTSTVFPFSQGDRSALLTANLSFSAVFWGFSGLCNASSLNIVTDLVPLDEIVVTVIPGPYFCNVTWNAERGRVLPGSISILRLELRGGHAAFLGYRVVVGPHYLRNMPLQNSDDLTVSGENVQSGVIMPTRDAAAFKGQRATRLTYDMIYGEFNDTTIKAPTEYQNGWLLGSSSVQIGELVQTPTEFSAAENVVVLELTMQRSSTYLKVLVLQTGTFLVVLGSIFAYMNTLRNAIEMAGKTLEWAMFTCCKKQRSRTHAFFMRPYEGPELRSMMGFKEYNDDGTTLKVMKRNEVSENVNPGV